jgi:carbon-monoxide dehydrogenase medium subunit
VRLSPSPASAYAKLHQRASHFAIVGVGATLDVSGGTIRSARVGLTGASSHALRLTKVEAALAGKPATAETIEAASRGVGADLEVVNADLHASEEYRRAMVDEFTKRAQLAALARAYDVTTLATEARRHGVRNQILRAFASPWLS